MKQVDEHKSLSKHFASQCSSAPESPLPASSSPGSEAPPPTNSNDTMTEITKKQQYLILLATSLGVLMNPLLASMLILALPNIGVEYLVSARDLGWMSTAYILANAICLVPGAWLSSPFSYKLMVAYKLSLATGPNTIS